ncbi:MAG: hypothetical protein ACFE8P_04555 [Promethearchaeota archaeon]
MNGENSTIMLESNHIKNSTEDPSKERQVYQELNTKGHTKEQLLTKDLKVIAQEFAIVERTKRDFAQIVINNQDKLDISEFINYPTFYIKESFIKKKWFHQTLAV